MKPSEGQVIADLFGALLSNDGIAADEMVDSLDLADCREYLKAAIGSLAAVLSGLDVIPREDPAVFCARMVAGGLEMDGDT